MCLNGDAWICHSSRVRLTIWMGQDFPGGQVYLYFYGPAMLIQKISCAHVWPAPFFIPYQLQFNVD